MSQEERNLNQELGLFERIKSHKDAGLFLAALALMSAFAYIIYGDGETNKPERPYTPLPEKYLIQEDPHNKNLGEVLHLSPDNAKNLQNLMSKAAETTLGGMAEAEARGLHTILKESAEENK